MAYGIGRLLGGDPFGNGSGKRRTFRHLSCTGARHAAADGAGAQSAFLPFLLRCGTVRASVPHAAVLGTVVTLDPHRPARCDLRQCACRVSAARFAAKVVWRISADIGHTRSFQQKEINAQTDILF